MTMRTDDVKHEASSVTRAPASWQAFALLGVLVFAWGGNYTWVSIALRDVGPWTFNAARYWGAAIVVGAALALRYGPRQIIPVRGERASLAAIGLLQGAVLAILITFSLKWIESTHTILLVYTNPVWVLILSVFLLREPLTVTNVSGVALGVLGIALLTNPLAMPWDAATVPGILAALAGTMAWALAGVLYRRRGFRSTLWQQVFWQLAVTAISVTLPAALFEWNYAIRMNPELVAIVVYNILVPTALAYWCWSQALTKIKPSTASQIMLLSPVFGVTQSHVVLGEPLTRVVLASAACIVTGACLTLSARPKRRR